MGLEQLPVGKSHTRDDEEDALKDRADHEACRDLCSRSAQPWWSLGSVAFRA